MKNIVVVGSQWGDEGKGKIVDWLSEQADIVIRFQGGHNAGHTLVIDGVTYKLRLLPSGIVRKNKISIIGNGVVVDPWALLDEIEEIKSKGVDVNMDNFIISEAANLILPFHREMDEIREDAAGKGKIGTTRRGIGPAYEDKVGRRGLRICDFFNKNDFCLKLKKIYDFHNIWLTAMDENELNPDEIFLKLWNIGQSIIPFVKPSWLLINNFNSQSSNILYEGAQGTFLDVDHGTYPYVTSSNTISSQAGIGSGFGPTSIDYTLGITKAYTTRVGSGPFPTEDKSEDGIILGKKGHEFGTVTGRQRRCGWFDSVLIKQAVALSSINGIALTKLDVLDGFKEIKICTGYYLDDKTINYLPSSEKEQKRLKPIYETMEGWEGSVVGIREFNELPLQAINYIKRIEKIVNCDVILISTSPERSDTIFLKNPFDVINLY